MIIDKIVILSFFLYILFSPPVLNIINFPKLIRPDIPINLYAGENGEIPMFDLVYYECELSTINPIDLPIEIMYPDCYQFKLHNGSLTENIGLVSEWEWKFPQLADTTFITEQYTLFGRMKIKIFSGGRINNCMKDINYDTVLTNKYDLLINCQEI